MSTTAAEVPRLRSAPRVAFGAVLFVAWGIESIIWVWSTVKSGGDITPIVTAVAALSLMIVLAGMEGLEVAVIDRWRPMFPERTTSELAGWLAARQLFVALIVTSATLLAHRDALIIPGTSAEIPEGIWAAVFDLTWTGFTVLWFAQIFPKHMAATNPDRYLNHTRKSLFPVVEVVRKVGVSQPGEWTAVAAQNRLDWHTPQEIEEAPPRHVESLADIWRELTPRNVPRSGDGQRARRTMRDADEPADTKNKIT
jgi:hypothetical protein